MKTTRTLIAVAALLLTLVACNKEELKNVSPSGQNQLKSQTIDGSVSPGRLDNDPRLNANLDRLNVIEIFYQGHPFTLKANRETIDAAQQIPGTAASGVIYVFEDRLLEENRFVPIVDKLDRSGNLSVWREIRI